MDPTRLLTLLTVGGILLVSLLSGPLVGAVDLTPERSESALGDGEADIEVTHAPERGRLDPRESAVAGYILSLPSATVEVSNLSGRPMIVYKLRIPELSYVAGTTHVLDERFTGQQTLSLDKSVLNRTSLSRETYRAKLLIIKRVQHRDTVLYRGKVMMHVGDDPQ